MNNPLDTGQEVMNYIDGKWEPSETDKWTERHDPADNSVLVARAPDSSRQDASRAVAAASRAGAEWRKWPAPKRGRVLFDWLSWIDSRKERLAELLTREEGKILP